MQFAEVLHHFRRYLEERNINSKFVKLTVSGMPEEIIPLELYIQREFQEFDTPFPQTANPPNAREFKLQGIEVEVKMVDGAQGSYHYREHLPFSA